MAKTTRTPLISGNWKMHHNHFEAISTVQKLAYLLHKDTYEKVDVSVHPPFTDIRSVQTVIESEGEAVGQGRVLVCSSGRRIVVRFPVGPGAGKT